MIPPALGAWSSSAPKSPGQSPISKSGLSTTIFLRLDHARPPTPPVEVNALECVAGRGVRGDRFFDHAPDYKGQITFFSREIIDQLRTELVLPNASPAAARRSVLVSGVELNTLVGVEFAVQGVRFFGTEECRPCYWMDGALGPGANAWLRDRGGLRARILSDGWLRLGPGTTTRP